METAIKHIFLDAVGESIKPTAIAEYMKAEIDELFEEDFPWEVIVGPKFGNGINNLFSVFLSFRNVVFHIFTSLLKI